LLEERFYVSLMLAIAGGGLVCATSFGLWAWDLTKNMVNMVVVGELRNDSAAAEASLLVGTNLALGNLRDEAAEQMARFPDRPEDVYDVGHWQHPPHHFQW